MLRWSVRVNTRFDFCSLPAMYNHIRFVLSGSFTDIERLP